MPDLSELSRKGVKQRQVKISSKDKKAKLEDTDLSLNAAIENAMLQRPNRPTPFATRPVPNIPDSMSESRIKKQSSNYGSKGKSLEETSSAASSPGLRKHTPATVPRTKFTSATPLEQRIAINKLKQKLDFEDKNEEPDVKASNGSKYMAKAESAAGASAVLFDQASISSMTESLVTSQIESDASDMVDTTRIVQRLNQVRDFLKQATSLYVNMSTKDYIEESKMDHMDKLGKLIQQLRIQEQGYINLLQRTLEVDQAANMTPSTSVTSLRPSEADEAEDAQQELEKLQIQHSLLKRIVDQQQQIQDLKKKQASLAALQAQAENLMIIAENERANGSSQNNAQAEEATAYTQSENINTQDCQQMPEEFTDNEVMRHIS